MWPLRYAAAHWWATWPPLRNTFKQYTYGTKIINVWFVFFLTKNFFMNIVVQPHQNVNKKIKKYVFRCWNSRIRIKNRLSILSTFLLMIRSMDLIMDYLTVSKRIEGKYLNNILLFMLVRLLVRYAVVTR